MRPITVLLLTVVVAVGLTSPLVASQSYITTTTTLSETHTSTTYSSSPVTTYSYTTASTQSYSASFTMSSRAFGTCYYESFPFDAQSGDVVTGTVHPGPLGVMLGIMRSSTYNIFSHSQSDTCIDIVARPSEHIDGNVDSNDVLHFTWKARSTDHYYFVIVNAGYDNGVKVDFAASQTGVFAASSTEYQTQTIQLLQTLVVYSTIYTSMPQRPQTNTIPQPTNNTPQLALALAVIAAVVIGAAFLYSRRKEPQVTKPKKVELKTEKAVSGKNFCIECGSELELGSKFCNNCGTKQP